MRILDQLKAGLIDALTLFIKSHDKTKRLSPKINRFIEEMRVLLAKSESAIELSSNTKNKISLFLQAHWLNPFGLFSPEHQLRRLLTSILNKDQYSTLQLLITSQAEDRLEIQQLKLERAELQSQIDNAAGGAHAILGKYQEQLRAYQDRFIIDTKRIELLTKEVDKLIEENESLKLAQSAHQREVSLMSIKSIDHSRLSLALEELNSNPDFKKWVESRHLSQHSQETLGQHFKWGNPEDNKKVPFSMFKGGHS